MDTQNTIEATTPKKHDSTLITTQKQDVAANTTHNNNNNNNKTCNNSATSPASPTSASSSPTHEFSFTISLHSSSTTTTTTTNGSTKSLFPSFNKTKTPNNNSNSSFAIDLSPADDIFFHGHLLPLHLLSHLPVSPRSSTNSLDSFTLPIKELLEGEKPNTHNNTNINNQGKNVESAKDRTTKGTGANYAKNNKAFSLFGWRKGNEDVGSKGNQQQQQQDDDGDEEEGMKNREKQKKKLSFDQLSHVIKRYARMVRPMLFFNNKNKIVRRRQNLNFHGGAHSFSGSWISSSSSNTKQNLMMMMMNKGGRRGGDYSAPASMRTSPTNSGLLVPNPTLCSSSTSDHSTMEELQAAIQAAIAHCKNSINT